MSPSLHPQSVERPSGEAWPPAAARFVGLALLALVATVPFAIEELYVRLSLSQTYYLKLAGLSVVILAIAVVVVLRLPLCRPTALFWSYLAYLLVIALSIAVLSLRGLGSTAIGFSVAAAVLPLTGAGVLLLFEVTPAGHRWRESLFLLLVIVGAVAAVYGIVQNFGIEFIRHAEPETERQVLVSFFGHSNFMGSYLGPILFLAAYFLMPRSGWPVRILAVATIVAILLCLVWAGTRAATLGALAGAISLIRLRVPHLTREQKRLLIVLGVAVVVVVVFTFGGQRWGRHRETLMRRFSSHREVRNRMFLWLVGIEMIRAHPVLGIGYGRYDTEFWPYCEDYVKQPGYDIYAYILREMNGLNPGQAHNELLEVACETGLLGVAAFLTVWVLALVYSTSAIVRGPPAESRMARYLRAALVFVFVDGLFGFPLQLPASALLFWVLLGCVAQTYRRGGSKRIAPAVSEPTGGEDLAAAESRA